VRPDPASALTLPLTVKEGVAEGLTVMLRIAVEVPPAFVAVTV
jgi:hypothetical protein